MSNPTIPTPPTRPTKPVQAHAHPGPKPESTPQSQDAEKAKEGASTGDLGAGTT